MNVLQQKLNERLSREVTLSVISDFQTLLLSSIAACEDARSLYEGWSAVEYYHQSACFLSKYVDENTDSASDRRQRAIVKWLAVEERNARTNRRIYSTDPQFNLGRKKRVSGWTILLNSAELIRRVIGSSPPRSLFQKTGFSGGATTSRKRGVDTYISKFVGTLDTTPDAWSAVRTALEHMETWSHYNPELLTPRKVKGNVLFTVPKTAVIDRVACKEPDVNIYAQKAVGDYIRKQLKRRARIDLNDQSVNRALARQGSIDGMIATIDLSSASDSLCTSLVHALLPAEWFRLLDALRCPKTFIDGKSHENEMFSSMGNGFTFELESLVFWALARSVSYFSGTRGVISVYGDDIIVPQQCAYMLRPVLQWCGFTVNDDKSFFVGHFKESCGGHYYRGNDVTPIYLRRPIKNVSDMILFLNQLRGWIIRTESDQLWYSWDSQHSPWVKLWYKYAKLVPKPLWGGYHLDSRTQLASAGPQQCELVEQSRKWGGYEQDRAQLGHYLSRLCELNKLDSYSWDEAMSAESHLEVVRSPETNPGAEPLSCKRGANFGSLRVPTRKYVMRRTKVEPAVFGVVRPLFLSEQESGYRSEV